MSRSIDIAFCMIIRNAAGMLQVCLESVAALADEIIVVDTGSTDDSPAIAHSFGAKLLHTRWNGDFAAARNEYLKAARCSWVLSLDSDEALEKVEREALHEFLRRNSETAFVFSIRNYFFMQDFREHIWPGEFGREVLPGVGYNISRTVRLFPRRRGVRYTYPVHESLRPSLMRKGIRLKPCRVPIHHMGYLYKRNDLAAKAALYKEIGLRKIAQFPNYFLGYYELGRVFLYEGETERAARMFANSIRLNPACDRAYYGLSLALLRLGRHEECRQWLQQALRRFPRNLDIHYLMGTLELEQCNEAQARQCFIRILANNPDHYFARQALLRACGQ